MSKEYIRESPLAQKCYWHRIISEVGGHFNPCAEQDTPTTRRRPPLVGLEECSQMQKRGWNNIEKNLLITTNSNSKSRLASSYSSQLRKSSGTRNTRRKKSQQAWFPEGAGSGRPILQDPKVKQLSTDSWPCRVPNNRLLRFAGWAASLFCPGESRKPPHFVCSGDSTGIWKSFIQKKRRKKRCFLENNKLHPHRSINYRCLQLPNIFQSQLR